MSKVKDYGEFDVSQDRDKYIGGSDIPAILGISKFTTRWQLLLEKAGLEERTFAGNRYTEYGHIIEPQIREYINQTCHTNFVPNRVINGDLRLHTDGFNGECVLEVKSTSDIHEKVEGYGKEYFANWERVLLDWLHSEPPQASHLCRRQTEDLRKGGLLGVSDRLLPQPV